GYEYHTGIVFAAYVNDVGQVARGGRYDHVGEVFGRTARGATGFSVDVRRLIRENLTDAEQPETIVVGEIGKEKTAGLWDEIQRLRCEGYIVVESGPRSEFDYELRHDGDGWELVPNGGR
ncbi:MAG: ATP phosphoribosyltransferase regulatory subunit, partial [Gammaproteobacteria bacterium]|nr:ATP phosphoribosyltransferase regulatory subunit [Gammaproteobacteria bacterium]